jgi:hypothetical protein
VGSHGIVGPKRRDSCLTSNQEAVDVGIPINAPASVARAAVKTIELLDGETTAGLGL